MEIKMHKAKEDLLVIAAQQGNEQAFNFLCKYYHASLSRFAYKLCSNSQLSQDALQEAWLKIAKKLRTLEDPRAFKGWIFKIVRWSVYDLMRKSVKEEAVFDCPDSMTEAVVEFECNENPRVKKLLALVEQLPEIDKQVIYLFYLEEIKITEIAEILQIPSGTIKSRLNRARKTLKAKNTELVEN